MKDRDQLFAALMGELPSTTKQQQHRFQHNQQQSRKETTEKQELYNNENKYKNNNNKKSEKMERTQKNSRFIAHRKRIYNLSHNVIGIFMSVFGFRSYSTLIEFFRSKSINISVRFLSSSFLFTSLQFEIDLQTYDVFSSFFSLSL